MAESTEAAGVETVTGRQGNTYQLEDLGHRWSKMTHPQCGKSVSFVNPRPDRVRWYTDSHRCDGPGWQGE